MSKQALDSEYVRDGLRDILLVWSGSTLRSAQEMVNVTGESRRAALSAKLTTLPILGLQCCNGLTFYASGPASNSKNSQESAIDKLFWQTV